ncbi:unnamed protein product [Dracunculus medinensis]|uniref:TPT domain-containing protein n=1 Tax=Dracunculus medinensis TaxID=318479 RepID=A0A0N4UDY4_DRAME|nr:unnamed protein product [Dracunculus medinensis]
MHYDFILFGFFNLSNSFIYRFIYLFFFFFFSYLLIIFISFLVSISNNLSLNFNISIPVLIIFRSGSLIAQLIMGRYLRNNFYSQRQIVSVLLLTVGIIIFTLADIKEHRKISIVRTSIFLLPSSLIASPGIALLTFGLFASAYLGICQENLYHKYGKHHEELMLFVHLLSLPAFIFFYEDIMNGISRLNYSLPLHMFEFPVPRLWISLVALCISQWICVKNVYKLTSVTSPLNVTIVVTMRKFISLTLSILIFKNAFNMIHLVGALLVFIGSILYTDDISPFLFKIKEKFKKIVPL